MSNQDATSVAHAWLDAFNSSDWDRAEAYLAPDSVYDEYGTQRHIEGSDPIVQLYKEWKAAMPDVKGNVTNTYTNGDGVDLGWYADGTTRYSWWNHSCFRQTSAHSRRYDRGGQRREDSEEQQLL